MEITDADRVHLERSVALAEQALDSGNSPFGSLLVAQDGTVLMEDHNRDAQGDPTRHPEIAIAYWSITHLSAEDRQAATVYTSGEHCPMCAAAHAWAGLGRIVYASSVGQLATWLSDFGVAPTPVAALSITEVAPGIEVAGPDAGLSEQVRELQRRHHLGTW